MKRLLLFCLSLSVVLPISAQIRLFSPGFINMAYSHKITQFVDSLYYHTHKYYPGYIDNLYHIPSRGFVIDKKEKSIIYYFHTPNSTEYSCDQDFLRKILRISDNNSALLSELFQVVVYTSSPQDDFCDSNECNFYLAYNYHLAGIHSPEIISPQHDLVRVCQTICQACDRGDESLIDSMAGDIIELISIYKKLLNYEFCFNPSDNFLTIGSVGRYLYVSASFDDSICYDKLSDYKLVMEKIARHLIENTFGPVNCNIDVLSNIKRQQYKVDDIEDIVIGIEDFTTERMITICDKVLAKSKKGDSKLQRQLFWKSHH